jgi:AbrB family looped-hinge helix DNA binding protein
MTRLDEATLTSQGQVSIPKKVRERLHLQKGAKVVFLEDEQGRVVIQEAEVPIDFTHEQWEEFLRKCQKEPVTRVRGKQAALRHLDRLMKKR